MIAAVRAKRLATSRRCTKRLHDARRAAQTCINSISHGPAVPGCAGRCRTCWTVKKGTA